MNQFASYMTLIPKDIYSKVKQIAHVLLMTAPYYLLCLNSILSYFVLIEYPWLLLAVAFTILPLLDKLFSNDQYNPSEKERKYLEQNDIYFRICLYITMIIDWITFTKLITQIDKIQISLGNMYQLVGIILTMGTLNGAQMTVSHELYHKLDWGSRIIGTLHLSKNLYMHNSFQHVYGHHKRVATPQDPATGRKDENLYRFFLRSYFGSYMSVYQMQKELNRPIYLNYGILSVVGNFIFISIIWALFSLNTALIFTLMALFSSFLLETINYVEHYGLLRSKISNGQYQKANIKHSWNTSHRISNYMLFKLQRHSDHHQNCLKPYQTLLTLKNSPHLPHGYPPLVLLAFVPNKWFQIMNPLVNCYRQQCGDIWQQKAKAYKKINIFLYQSNIVLGILIMFSLMSYQSFLMSQP